MKKLILFTVLFLLWITQGIFSQYIYVTKWGISGSGNGQFNGPFDVAVDNNTNVYVSDRENHRIQKFDQSGSFITTWGTYGSGNGQFNRPHGICVAQPNLIDVADFENNRIQIFTSTGVYQNQWASSGAVDVAVDHTFNVYILDFGQNTVTKYDLTGSYLLKWGKTGSGNGEFNNPISIAIDANDNIYVVDQHNYRVQIFNTNGQYLGKWGTFGSGNGQFDTPYGIAVDPDGNVLVADYGNNRIEKFTSTGTFLTKWGTSGNGNGQFNGPTGVACDNLDGVYVADYNNSRIQKFRFKTGYSITTGSVPSPLCGGSQLTVPYSVSQDFNASNTFTAQLSNSTGDFTNAINIGTLVSTTSGIISCTIPQNTLQGYAYRIRVVGSDPYIIGTDNGLDLIINAAPSPTFSSAPGTACQFIPGVVYRTGNYSSYSWNIGGILGGDYTIQAGGGNNNFISLTWLNTGSKSVSVTVTDANGCQGTSSCTTTINQGATPGFISAPTTCCQGASGNVYTIDNYQSYNWHISGVPGVDYFIEAGGGNNNSATLTWLTASSKTVSIDVTNSYGCPGNTYCYVNVLPQPLPNLNNSSTFVCMASQTTYSTGQYSGYKWIFSGKKGTDYSIISGGTDSSNFATLSWLTLGLKSVTVEVTGQNSCKGSTSTTFNVIPVPNPVFTKATTNICAGTSGCEYMTGSFSSYTWTIPGKANTDYILESGGLNSSDNVQLTWLTGGEKIISVEVANQGGCTSSTSSTVTVFDKPQATITGNLAPCENIPEVYKTTAQKGTTILWNVTGGTIVGPPNADSVLVNWSQAGNGSIKVTILAAQNCNDSTNRDIVIKQMPTVTLSPLHDVCAGDAAITLSGGSPDGGTYSGTGVSGGLFNPKSVGPGKYDITYTFQNPNGCFGTAVQTITVNPVPPKPVIQQNGKILTSSVVKGNQWFLNGVAIQGATQQTYTFITSGDYQVQVTDENGCVSDMSDKITIVGVKDKISSNTSLTIEPNPAGDLISIKLDNSPSGIYNIELLNILGKIVYHAQINNSNNIINYSISTLNIPDGFYLLKISIGRENYFGKVLIEHK